MNKHVKIVVVLFLIGALGLLGFRYGMPLYEDWRQRGTSDARGIRGKLRIAMDNWVGYAPLCSKDLRKRLRRQGYLLKCQDDSADYSARMTALSGGEIEFAVATVDSFLLNAAALDFPGTIIAVIDESKGGDALVAWEERFADLDQFKQATEFKIAMTPDSPSDHLLKSLAVHFDVAALKNRGGGWRVAADGSQGALEALRSRGVDAAVLWEPDVSLALSIPGIKKILSTADTANLIVDILVVNRRFSDRDPEAVHTLLAAYFKTLKHYRDHPDQLRAELIEERALEPSQVSAMLQGVAWATLGDNARYWFGSAGEGAWANQALVDTLESSSQILLDYGDFSGSPIPDGDPYRLLNSIYVSDLFQSGLGDTATGASEGDPLTRSFTELQAKQWDELRSVGTLKVRPIIFQSGLATLTSDGKQELDLAAENLRHYPNFRLQVKGHTGVRGDPQANRQLSLQRAEAVARYLGITFSVDANRMRPVGRGGQEPLSRKPGESGRSYNYRLPRVELVLVAEEF